MNASGCLVPGPEKARPQTISSFVLVIFATDIECGRKRLPSQEVFPRSSE